MSLLPKVLLVEDDERQIAELMEILSFAGYHVIHTASIKTAWTYLKEAETSTDAPFHAVVLDYYLLDGERGEMLLDLMQQHAFTIPVIAHSSMADANVIMCEKGAQISVLKRFNPDSRQQLISALESI